jgi:hypothetical protein
VRQLHHTRRTVDESPPEGRFGDAQLIDASTCHWRCRWSKAWQRGWKNKVAIKREHAEAVSLETDTWARVVIIVIAALTALSAAVLFSVATGADN